jgi:hypothetical protein
MKLHHHQLLIIYKVYLDLSMNLHQLPTMRTVLMPIINLNNRKIWFTGIEKRTKGKKITFFYASPIIPEKKKERKKAKQIYLIFFISWQLFVFHTHVCVYDNAISLCLEKLFKATKRRYISILFFYIKINKIKEKGL